MEYQEIITAYENKGLDITDLKERLEIAKPLKGREKYRALDMIAQRSALINDISNVLIISEIPDRVEMYNKDSQKVLEDYYDVLIKSIKQAKAWKFMKLVPSEHTIDEFNQFNETDKFKAIYEINKKYLAFLEYQKVADIRDCIRNAIQMSDDAIRRLAFIEKMFLSFKNKDIINEFFCFDKKFLMALVDFRKSKQLRMEDYIKSKNKHIQQEYEKFLNFFTIEDFRNISECLVLTSKTLKISVGNVIEAFSELSESESEIAYLEDEYKEIKKLEKKCLRMKVIEAQYEKEKIRNERLALAKKIAEEKTKKAKEALEKKKEEERINALKKQFLEKKEKEKQEELRKQEDAKKEPTKEQVNPLILSWLEQEDTTFTRRIGNKMVSQFFAKIIDIQEKTGIRVSLFIVTNASKEVALKRLIDINKKAKTNGLPDLVEGIFGGYSSFRIDTTGKLTNVAVMSKVNKQKIAGLLEITKGSNLTKDKILSMDDAYLRYQLTDRRDKSINMDYLNLLIKNILADEKVRRQPLKFLPYIEGKCAGIDVVLESQLKGISQLPEFYKQKYNIAPKKTMNARIDRIENFIEM